jgi:hypothetical protein
VLWKLDRSGVELEILVYYARGRGFDSRTAQTFVCMNMSVLGLRVSMYNMYGFTKEVYKYVYLFVKSLILAAFEDNTDVASMASSLMCSRIDLSPSSGNINRLMMTDVLKELLGSPLSTTNIR